MDKVYLHTSAATFFSIFKFERASTIGAVRLVVMERRVLQYKEHITMTPVISSVGIGSSPTTGLTKSFFCAYFSIIFNFSSPLSTLCCFPSYYCSHFLLIWLPYSLQKQLITSKFQMSPLSPNNCYCLLFLVHLLTLQSALYCRLTSTSVPHRYAEDRPVFQVGPLWFLAAFLRALFQPPPAIYHTGPGNKATKKKKNNNSKFSHSNSQYCWSRKKLLEHSSQKSL